MELTSLDQLYETLVNAEAREAAALMLLNLTDDIAVRAAYEEAVEGVEDAREAYEAAVNETARLSTAATA